MKGPGKFIRTFFILAIMIISSDKDLKGITEASKVVAKILFELRSRARAGINTAELDHIAGELMNSYGARSAPKLIYDFPGNTCISLGTCYAHGVPNKNTVLKNGDLINIDVSAELHGYFADNGCSFVVGNIENEHSHLIRTSQSILAMAINSIRSGVKLSAIGKLIHEESKKSGYTVIKDLTGHGIGKSLHEEPKEILNYYSFFDNRAFLNGQVIALETFISTKSNYSVKDPDGWSLRGNKGGFIVQHEHTILVRDHKAIILTENNGIGN